MPSWPAASARPAWSPSAPRRCFGPAGSSWSASRPARTRRVGQRPAWPSWGWYVTRWARRGTRPSRWQGPAPTASRAGRSGGRSSDRTRPGHPAPRSRGRPTRQDIQDIARPVQRRARTFHVERSTLGCSPARVAAGPLTNPLRAASALLDWHLTRQDAPRRQRSAAWLAWPVGAVAHVGRPRSARGA